MSNFFDKIVLNLKTNYYVSSGIEKIKQNSLVSSSVEVCNIAKEVYTQVQQEEETNRLNIEDHYSQAITKITNVPQDVIQSRADYTFLQKSASTGRKV